MAHLSSNDMDTTQAPRVRDSHIRSTWRVLLDAACAGRSHAWRPDGSGTSSPTGRHWASSLPRDCGA